MTVKVFWDDPYATTHETQVTAVTGSQVQLASTILFAFSGGQESDQGTIGGFAVMDARKNGRSIDYRLPPDHNLEIGQSVLVEIDWARRYRLMRLHFAAELVLELVYRELEGVDKIGAHIAAHKARLDFRWPENITPLLAGLSRQANAIIASDRTIQTGFDDIEQERRYWEIEGFSKVSCGGTHVHTTREVGPIRLKRNNIGNGKERIEIVLLE